MADLRAEAAAIDTRREALAEHHALTASLTERRTESESALAAIIASIQATAKHHAGVADLTASVAVHETKARRKLTRAVMTSAPPTHAAWQGTAIAA
ncbi:hypothetical protein RN607_03555 [Demequina capsici]|uniref:Uncharacterized protein n=1 Tax=Demequina capsici TaxID=3075620 RepID=A0AA96FGI0_9MICO|nr:hypothetical protein [Demequina sp. PMTSA13]WNM28091.1 hypothetical protein RN607_03555 [Demequina sp. PMTSA13]